MRIKYYKATADQVCRYFYAMEFHQQMTVNYTFGGQAQDAGITVLEYIFYLIHIGKFRYKGIIVKLIE